MRQLLGAMLIAASSWALGIAYVNMEKRRLRALRSAEHMLRMMSGELSTRMPPLPELFSQLEQRCDDAAAAFVSNINDRLPSLGERMFTDIWNDSLSQSFSLLPLEDREILSTLGNSLGRYDLESQLAELGFALDQLGTAIARHSTSLPERKRLGMGLAWAGGALLVIALL